MVASRAARGAWELLFLYIGFGVDSAPVSAREVSLKKCLALLGLCVLLATGPALAEVAAPTNQIAHPDWLEWPSAEMLARVYPPLALALEIEGAATLECTTNQFGALQACKVGTEVPRDQGFGFAAMALAPQFRMRAKPADGRPVAGGVIKIPIRFRLPQAEEPALPAVKPSASALVLGLGVVDGYGFVRDTLAAYEKSARELENMPGRGAPAESRAVAAQALRRASRAHEGQIREAYAMAFASTYSEPELARIAAFLSSPSAALMQVDAAHSDAIRRMANEYRRVTGAEANIAFCRDHDCDIRTATARILSIGVERPADVEVGSPSWRTVFSGLARGRPPIAAALELTGMVRLVCKVAAGGMLDSCIAEQEWPTGLGYGAATVRLANGYSGGAPLISPSLIGKSVGINIDFPPFSSLPSNTNDPPYVRPQSVSLVGLALARRLVEINGTANGMRTSTARVAQRFAASIPTGADSAIYKAALAAYAIGSMRAQAQYLENLAATLASQFSENQIEGAIAFEAGPMGTATNRKRMALETAMAEARRRALGAVQREARENYCMVRDCTLPPSAANFEGAARSH